ncbi:Acetyltransferase [Kitasatospora sp. MMS16-BH015]|uniref:GNAT family N-acetyltransferase n=1 Tax=Kitasatospora sp. MMS16-BH015 TaxID=2018025 RepID=UPI000CA1735D|nr:GNAT family N-acetyltransferase [Kitasatospora sp. MMS16-BH015]AUG76989.1 Acetyltransferase [Kitasatospora sp. MMS16-BH015]
MTDFTIIDDRSEWQRGYEERLRARLAAGGLGAAAVEKWLALAQERLAEATVAEIGQAGEAVGYVAVALEPQPFGTPTGRLLEIRVRPGAERHRLAARQWAEGWCAEHGARQIRIRALEPDELYADWAVGGQTRIRPAEPARDAERLTYRPMTEAEYEIWLAEEKEAYVGGMLGAGTWTEAEARTKSDKDFAELLPQGLHTPENSVLLLLDKGVGGTDGAEGEPVGTAWLKHGYLPGVSYGYSLRVHPEHRGKGYGRDAMAVGEQATLAGGDQALMFNVFGGNAVAINLYTTAGYAVLEEVRAFDL